ncbi:hypothetical protein [Zhongshania sp.]|uniref:hypothetical protein n=1 Tax=Zhongshania sp. TaxID=1971902 RepID=UPI00356608CF
MRLVVIVGLCHVLTACQAREPVQSVVPLARKQIVEEGAVLAKESPSPRGSAAVPIPVLDLSLPRAAGTVIQDSWGDGARNRYRVGEWFNAGARREEARLKVKSKLLIKEAAVSEYSFSSFADSVNGAEVGFEYKTR